MNLTRKGVVLGVALLTVVNAQAKIVIHENKDLKLSLSGKFTVFSDVHNNSSLLNGNAVGARDNKKVDFYFLQRSNFELTTNIAHVNGVEAQTTLRSKFTWGTPRLSTSSSSIKYGESLIGSHSHNFERNTIYMREAWLKLGFDELFGFDTWQQTLTVGLFPFKLGRGIALGDAFAVDPSSLGFYSDSSVDQYAPGLKISGNAYWESLKYDFYWSVMKNNMAKLSKTGDQIYDQLIVNGSYVANTKFARGSGDLDWRIASRLKWTPIDNKETGNKIHFEPYAMYAHDPSQDLEFTADASSKLGTFGLAGEFQFRGVEFGFDTAFNRGHQNVFAWDRNKVTTKTDSVTGALTQVYSHVFDDEDLSTKTVYTGNTTNYRPSSSISSAMNSQEITGTGKYNGSKRFRDAYRVDYKGFMFVADASMFIYKDALRASIAGGISRGDTLPSTRTGSRATAVRSYKGFITQQETYSGSRVKSVFVTSKLVRPKAVQDSTSFSTNTEGFTNLIFAGMGLAFAPKDWSRKFEIKPNIIVFWQDVRSKKYNSVEDASNRLGTEINTCASLKVVENLKLVLNAAFFLPGKHYTDLKGTPLSSGVASLVKNAQAGVEETLPTLGSSTAFTLSLGMEYSF